MPSPEPENPVLQSVKNKLAHSLLTKATRKRKSKDAAGDENDPSEKDPEDEETYKLYGRHLARTCGMSERIHVIVEHGVRVALASSDDDAPRPQPNAKQQLKLARLTASWDIICDAIPGFREEMIELGGNTKLRKSVCQQIQAGSDDARGDDSNKLKGVVIDWLLHFHDPDVPIPAADIPSRTSKTGRAFDSPLTGEALHPHEYPATTDTYTKMKNGDKSFPLNGKMPAFLYPRDHPYNEDDIEEKLLEGPLPIAEPGFHRGRAGNAARNGQDALRPRDVGYVCTQVYFGLSNLSSWAARDGKFSYTDFYWSIVDIFAGGEGQAILDNFNYHVFGDTTRAANAEPDQAPVISAYEQLAVQRAAKRMRLAAALQPGGSGS
ncbi:hypothetical protein B0H14DRAFT_3490393 [Mycena olivaceomarginata]|nr:hypothetical protein B0H14DRAFT_3490393 [Mycena olivaceomarginata]